MQIYEVRISHGARVDMAELRKFLKAMMTVEGAIRYANNMREEIKTVSIQPLFILAGIIRSTMTKDASI